MPFYPPESPLNRIERTFQQAGYAVVIGTDFTVQPPMGVEWIGDAEIVRAPDEHDEQLAELAENWLAGPGQKLWSDT